MLVNASTGSTDATNGSIPRTAVLFLVFNRPDVTERVLAAIRAARPPRLYIAADGARADRPSEAIACDTVRRLIETGVDWPCTVKTLFRDQNLGCRRAVSTAIDWFFQHEEAGIILEDDCLPHPSFFSYCEELLDHYRDDTRVMHINGSNIMRGWVKDPDYSYYFSRHSAIWGWASWRRAWQHYNVATPLLPEIHSKNYLWRHFFNPLEARMLLRPLWATHTGKLDTWDYQWSFALLIQSGLSIMPAVNLISNIGFGEDATHTVNTSHPLANLPTEQIPLPLRHPSFVIRDTVSDYRELRSTLRNKILARLRSVTTLL
ncbi:glycosyltransferase family 2 protein [Hymenobacter qilianensis]|uniref:Nucleotide-diphospho-sugar transferase n=1 Tax=Hymenobacter qilianensis TaxID=1385715 RepID=A0A7H0GVM5_9BACT|nr:glycosyltransferase family A protein [Hymenobacter qilianensis]QNP52341.1 nucleotide-diphospho-sugar transferase [Hymenobacter qilianensis]